MRTPTVARRRLNVALVVLVVLHVVPPPGDPQWILAGFLPWDLGVHLLWMLVATVVVLYMTGPPWPDEPPPPYEPPPGDRSPPEGGERS